MVTFNVIERRNAYSTNPGRPGLSARLAALLERPMGRTLSLTILTVLLAVVVIGVLGGALLTGHYQAVVNQFERQNAQYAYFSNRIAALEQEVALLTDEAAAREVTYRKMISILESYGTDIPIAQRQEFVQVVYHESMKHELDPILAMAVIKVESTFDPTAVSPVGAVGLMQVIPYVGKYKAQQLGIPWRGEKTLYDPFVNVQIGIAYLKELEGQFNDFGLALEAYNRGPTSVRNTMTAGINPSRYYANRVMRAYTRFQKI